MSVAALKNSTPGSGSRKYIHLVDDEPVDEARIAPGDRRGADVQPKLSHHFGRGSFDRLAADDGRDGNDRRTRLLHIAARMPGTARMGSTLTKGFEGQMMMARRSRRSSAASASGCARAVSAPANMNSRTAGLTLPTDEVFLEIEPSFGGQHARAHGIVAHRQYPGGDAQGPTQVRRDFAQSRRPAPVANCAPHAWPDRRRRAETSSRRPDPQAPP